MDFNPDQPSNHPAHNTARTHNLLGDSTATRPTAPFDKRRSCQNNDPQSILNDLFPPSVRYRGRPISGSHEADREFESSDSSVVYLGHNVFETHKTFDFLYHSTNKQRPATGSSAAHGGGGSNPTSRLPLPDPATQSMIDSDIVHWATAIPGNLPLKLSAWAASLPGPSGRMPPATEYPIMVFLAIFGSPERRLTDEGIFGALIEVFECLRPRGGRDSWKVDVINCISLDARFKASDGDERSWTVDISEVHRNPFIRRDARDRPMRLLPPGPKSRTSDRYPMQPSTGYMDVGRARSYSAPASDAVGTNAPSNLQRQSLSTGTTPLGTPPGSHIPSPFNTTYYITPHVHLPPPPRRNVNPSGNLPSYSEILPTGEARDDHDHATSADLDNHLVLPSIREVLGPEMHLVEERRRTYESERPVDMG